MLGNIYTDSSRKYQIGDMIEDLYVDRYRVVKCLGFIFRTKKGNCYRYQVERIEA